MKRLLITSDDFGMCHAVNLGTVQAMNDGIVRSTNLMAPCPWVAEAAALCVAHGLPSGVHLTLTCEWDRMKWRPLTAAPQLRDELGYFPASHQALEGRVSAQEVRAEFEAQIDVVRGLGIEPTHLDTHMLPSHAAGEHAELVQGIAADLARCLGIPFTYERVGGSLRYFRDELEISSFSDDYVAKRLASWREPGTYHLTGHAAVPSEELRALSSVGHENAPWSEAFRARDLRFFTDPATRQALLRAGFDLIDVGALLHG